MAKKLLEYVQDCLESMTSDQVSSISGADTTEEAITVANIAKQTYEFMHVQFDWPYLKELTTLEGISTPLKPNYLKIPDNVSEVLWFKYNGLEKSFQSPQNFLDESDAKKAAFLSGDTTIIEVEDFNGVKLYIKNNQEACHYTSFDNTHLVFDAYDSVEETTMHQSKTAVYAVKTNTFTLSDNFEPVLPVNMEPLFQAEINVAAHLLIKQQASPVDEKRSLKGRARQKSKADRVNKVQRSGFGRK